MNPANALADLIETWHVPARVTPQSVRFNGAVDSAEFWKGHRTAARYLMEIEDALTALEAAGENVDFYRETVPAWYRAVFSQSVPWSTQTNDSIRRVSTVAEIRLLRALGAHIAAVKWVPPLDNDHLNSLRDALNRARELVLADDDLLEEVKRYILGLIHEASECLDDSQLTDAVRMRSITMELGGAMSTVSEMKSDADPKKQKWSEGAKNVLRSISDKMTQKAIEMGVDQAAHAIGNLT